MKKYLFLLLTTYAFSASSFGDAGVASIDLSEGEKQIFSNKKDITSLKRDVTKLKLQLSSIKESVDGMKSIVESTNDKISQTSQKTSNISDSDIQKLKKRIDSLESENNKRFKKIERSIEKLITLLSSKKNTSSRDKEEDKKQKLKSPKKIKEKKLTPKAAFLKAEKLFAKKKYKSALEYYVEASDKKYNLSYTYFKMGDSFYYQKKYEEAVSFYKKSIGINDKPKYLSKLLLHSGISFKNIGDKNTAKSFLQAVVDGFPKSSDAKLASKLLKKL